MVGPLLSSHALVDFQQAELRAMRDQCLADAVVAHDKAADCLKKKTETEHRLHDLEPAVTEARIQVSALTEVGKKLSGRVHDAQIREALSSPQLEKDAVSRMRERLLKQDQSAAYPKPVEIECDTPAIAPPTQGRGR
jgi:vacuolar-type H+-ATPase subunit I/STV1